MRRAPASEITPGSSLTEGRLHHLDLQTKKGEKAGGCSLYQNNWGSPSRPQGIFFQLWNASFLFVLSCILIFPFPLETSQETKSYFVVHHSWVCATIYLTWTLGKDHNDIVYIYWPLSISLHISHLCLMDVLGYEPLFFLSPFLWKKWSLEIFLKCPQLAWRLYFDFRNIDLIFSTAGSRGKGIPWIPDDWGTDKGMFSTMNGDSFSRNKNSQICGSLEISVSHSRHIHGLGLNCLKQNQAV